MLESHRVRKFFTEDPEGVAERVRDYARDHGGEAGSGFRSLAVFVFEPDDAYSRRFLSVAVRDRSSDPRGEATGNITLRFRDEPGGDYQERARELLGRLEEDFPLRDHPGSSRETN